MRGDCDYSAGIDGCVLATAVPRSDLSRKIHVMKTTAAQKVKRDALVVADRAPGLRWATVAERHGLSETMCRNIWRERRSAEDFRTLRPAEVVDEAVAQLEAVVEELAELAASTNNDAVRLGAIKARAATLIQRVELLQALGRVPVAARLRFEVNMEAAANAVLAILDRYGLPDSAAHELVDALRADPIGLEAPGRRLALIDGN